MPIITYYEKQAPKEEPRTQKQTMILVNAQTNTFDFVINPKAHEVPDALTVDDRRELVRIGFGNEDLAAKAKQVYAAGGRIKDIKNKCSVSLSYAKKLHMAFGRAKKGSKFKKQH
jgi:hypothetical protein